jgi:hypothetical protein
MWWRKNSRNTSHMERLIMSGTNSVGRTNYSVPRSGIGHRGFDARTRLARPPAATSPACGCPRCGRRPASRAEAWVLREELATVWLVSEPGSAGEPVTGVADQRFCRACAPTGPVSEIACVVCTDGPLLTGPLVTGAGEELIGFWLSARGWRRGPIERDRAWLCPRCAPVVAVPGARLVSLPEVLPTAAGQVGNDADGDSGKSGEWTLW